MPSAASLRSSLDAQPGSRTTLCTHSAALDGSAVPPGRHAPAGWWRAPWAVAVGPRPRAVVRRVTSPRPTQVRRRGRRPRQRAGRARRPASHSRPDDEYVRGWGLMAQEFESGHVLALRAFPRRAPSAAFALSASRSGRPVVHVRRLRTSGDGLSAVLRCGNPPHRQGGHPRRLDRPGDGTGDDGPARPRRDVHGGHDPLARRGERRPSWWSTGIAALMVSAGAGRHACWGWVASRCP